MIIRKGCRKCHLCQRKSPVKLHWRRMGGRVNSDPTPEQVGGGSLLFLSPIRAGKYGMAWHHCGWLPPEPLILSSLPLPYLPCHSPQHARGTRQLSERRPSSYPPPPVSRRPVPAADNPCRRSCKMGQVVRGDGGQSPFTLVVKGVRGLGSSCLWANPGFLTCQLWQVPSSLPALVFSSGTWVNNNNSCLLGSLRGFSEMRSKILY